MKNIKKLSTEKIKKKLNKLEEKIQTSKLLLYLAMLTGVILLMGGVAAYVCGAIAFAKASFVVSAMQSVIMMGVMGVAFSLDQKETILKQELKVREEIEKASQEFCFQYAKTQQKDKSQSKNKKKEEICIKDDQDIKKL